MHTFPFCITIAIAVLVADSLKSAKCYMAQCHVQAQLRFNLVNKIMNAEQPLTIMFVCSYSRDIRYWFIKMDCVTQHMFHCLW